MTMTTFVKELSEPVVSSVERYERGQALKNAGQYKSAIEQFEMAVTDQMLVVKAYAQIGLCLKIAGHYKEAVSAFQKALQSPSASPKETVQILYVLGRTLESLGRVSEALESYRWIRRESPEYRDVVERIERLSSQRLSPSGVKKNSVQDSTQGGALVRSWQGLFGKTG